MSKIKVMHLISHMGDGGAQRVVLNYLRDFQNDDLIELKLFVYRSKSNSFCDLQIEEKGYNVCYLNVKDVDLKIKLLNKIVNNLRAYFVWKKTIKEYNPSIVHNHISILLEQTLFPIVRNNVPVRFSTLHSNPYRFKGKTLRVIKKAFNDYNFIPVCLNDIQVSEAKSYYGISDHENLANGLDIDAIKDAVISRGEARNKLGISNNEYIIIGVGRLNKIKRFDLLIEAFAIVLERKKESRLLIAGDGPEMDSLIDLVKKLGLVNNVDFLGNVDNIVELYCSADMLGLTSESEALSLTLIEAQLCDVHCVISNGVPDESIISTHVNKMEKGASPFEWASALLDVDYKGEKVKDADFFDSYNISQKLKEIYLKRMEIIKDAKK